MACSTIQVEFWTIREHGFCAEGKREVAMTSNVVDERLASKDGPTYIGNNDQASYSSYEVERIQRHATLVFKYASPGKVRLVTATFALLGEYLI
ncbi:hypothetical protein HDV00_002228 [Rhizophlyctis rosea]|nr:hypothetical protein HDV00_002228 [Rhizophlyctis rosea]